MIGGIGNTIDINDLLKMDEVVKAVQEREKEINEEKERL
jgi:hypothetical protein